MEVLIEKEAGFCFGVVSAIDKCENCLEKFGELYCLGELVHNSMEISRLKKLGLRIIDVKDLEKMQNCRVMIRLTENRLRHTLLQKKSNRNF